MSDEILYNQLYEKTKEFGRTQFIREIMKLERENKQLEEQLKQKDEVIDEAIKKTKIVKEYKFDLIGRHEMLDILTKYKGDNNG